MRRLATTLLLAAAVLLSGAAGALAAALGVAGAAMAQAATTDVAPVDVFQVDGLLDPVVVNGIERAIDRAEATGAQALVLQVGSKGATVSSERLARLAERIGGSKVPVTIWVGPSGARFTGSGAWLLAASPITGMAPGTRVGDLGARLPVGPGGPAIDLGPSTDALIDGTMNDTEARTAGVLKPGPGDGGTPTLGDFLVSLDGARVGDVTLHTAEVVQTADGPRRQAVAQAVFLKLPLVDRLFHTVASPEVAYLLLTAGLLLLVFEFFTAGVGVAGVVGAACLVFAGYGIAVLPARWWAVALIVGSVIAFSVDVQTGVPRVWTAIGGVMYLTGSLWLWDGVSMSWITLLVGLAATALTVLTGMPAMVRTRFATPTIGREWLVGEMGVAIGPVDPDGTVEIRGARWKARTNRATPIADGGSARVVSIEGTLLEVEPEVGAARDHRERRARSPQADS